MIDWAKGYQTSYYMAIVDPDTWLDIDRIEITGGKITRSGAELQESADVDCRLDNNGEQWVRIYMGINQRGATENVALMTGLASAPGTTLDGRHRSNAVEIYSVLKPSQDILLPRGWYVPAGANGAKTVAELLDTPAPVIVDDTSPNLVDAIVAEDNETNLSMAYKILEAINWRMRITGDGRITLCPMASSIASTYDRNNDMVETRVKITYDWYAAPNVYRVTSGDMTAVARDDDPDSPLSTVSRGREIWQQSNNVTLADDETVASCAYRLLQQAQQVARKISYDRRYDPDVLVGDIVRLNYADIAGDYIVTSQTLTLGGSVAEEVQTV